MLLRTYVWRVQAAVERNSGHKDKEINIYLPVWGLEAAACAAPEERLSSELAAMTPAEDGMLIRKSSY